MSYLLTRFVTYSKSGSCWHIDMNSKFIQQIPLLWCCVLPIAIEVIKTKSFGYSDHMKSSGIPKSLNWFRSLQISAMDVINSICHEIRIYKKRNKRPAYYSWVSSNFTFIEVSISLFTDMLYYDYHTPRYRQYREILYSLKSSSKLMIECMLWPCLKSRFHYGISYFISLMNPPRSSHMIWFSSCTCKSELLFGY